MNLGVPSKTVFYTIEKTIKSYRKFSRDNFLKVVDNITIDQKLILQYIKDYPELNQKEIAELVFKDNASLTRMIDIMVNKKFIKRSINDDDRRRFKIEITNLPADEYSIEIYDSIGRTLFIKDYTFKSKKGKTFIKLSTRKFKPGMNFVKLYSGKVYSVKKIIVN